MKRLYVPLPDKSGRRQLINILLKTNVNNLTPRDVEEIVEGTEGKYLFSFMALAGRFFSSILYVVNGFELVPYPLVSLCLSSSLPQRADCTNRCAVRHSVVCRFDPGIFLDLLT